MGGQGFGGLPKIAYIRASLWRGTLVVSPEKAFVTAGHEVVWVVSADKHVSTALHWEIYFRKSNPFEPEERRSFKTTTEIEDLGIEELSQEGRVSPGSEFA